MCKEAGYKSYCPCGKPGREKAFELHTVSEIMLDVVWNIIGRLITAAFSWESASLSLLCCMCASKGSWPHNY